MPFNFKDMELSAKQQRFRRKILTDAEVQALAKATKALLGPEVMAISGSHHLSIEDSLRYMSLAARLEDGRAHRGLTLKEAAKELKAPKYRLEEIEKGQLNSISPGLLLQYIEYLDLKVWFRKWKKANPELSGRMGLTATADRAKGSKRASMPVLVKTLAEKKIDTFLKKRIPPWAKGPDPIVSIVSEQYCHDL